MNITSVDFTEYLKKHYKSILVLVICIVLFSILIIFISNQARLEVIIKNPTTNSETKLQITDQQNNSTQTISTQKSSTNINTNRGPKQLLVSAKEGSYFSVFTMPGYFANTTIETLLQPQKERSFIANNPASCMQTIDSILVSYNCGDNFRGARAHQPATSTTPPTIQNNTNNIVSGTVEGNFTEANTTYMLINTPTSSPLGAAHVLYSVDKNLNATQKRIFTELNSNRGYKLQQIPSGFVIYDNEWNNAYYLKNSTDSLRQITLSKPKDSSLTNRQTITFTDNDILLSYANTEPFALDPKTTTISPKTEVIIQSNNTTEHYNFEAIFTQTAFCGTKKLCLVTKNQLDVYDITKKSKAYQINGVFRIHQSPTQFLAITATNILALDINNEAGYIYIGLENSSFNSIENTNSGVVVSVNNTRNEPVALLVDEQNTTTSPIDQKINQILRDEAVSTVSVYKNKIFITPELGELVFDQTIQAFTFNPTKVKEAQATILKLIENAGIDTSKYIIINPTL